MAINHPIKSQATFGNIVTAVYTHITGEYSPRLVVLLGIAGGIHKDIDVCDAMFAESIVYYDSRKEADYQRDVGVSSMANRRRVSANKGTTVYRAVTAMSLVWRPTAQTVA